MLRSYLKICWEHPKRLLALATVITVLLAVFTYGRLDFNADRTALFKASAGEKARQAEFERRFGGWHDLVLVVRWLDGLALNPLIEQTIAAISE